LTGFSHGAAGIAFALLCLHGACGDARFLAAAEQALDYEAAVFYQSQGNWPDFRSAQKISPVCGNTWCHGAPGIGLARVGGLSQLDTPELRRDIETALSATRAMAGTEGYDHLCCGHFGRLDLLLATARRLDRPELEVEGRRWASDRTRRAQAAGHFDIQAGVPGALNNPSLFHGTAGIGYQLLRLVYPLPSMLLWE